MDLNSVKLKNTAIAAVFAAGSLLALGYTALVVSDLSSAKDARVKIEEQLEKRFTASCEKAFAELEGFEMVSGRKTIQAAKQTPISNPNQELALVTASMQSCQGYTLQSFCMGSGCANPLEIKLKQG